MRKLIALVLVAAFVLGGALQASAAEFKAKGRFDFTFAFIDNGDFYDWGEDGANEDKFHARQRVRVQIDIIASESLKGVLYFEIGEQQWGYGPHGADLSADGVNIETKNAYISFNIPDTDLVFNVGIQGLALPSVCFGTPIFDDDVAAVVAAYTVNDMVSVVAFWARLYDDDLYSNTNDNSHGYDNFDAFGLVVPVTGEGWMIAPFVTIAWAGKDSVVANAGDLDGLLSPAAATLLSADALLGTTYAATALADDEYLFAWWLGLPISITALDPLTINFELMYGAVESDEDAVDRRGWYVAASIDYKMDMLTPSLFGWYSSGEDGDWSNGSEQFPYVTQNFGPSSFVFDGSSLLDTANIVPNADGPCGKWAIGIALKDISFIEDLTHTLRFIYARGTNEPSSRRIYGNFAAPLGIAAVIGYKNGLAIPAGVNGFAVQVENVGLTTEDYMIEVNFDHKYQIYENLAAYLELGYAHLEYGNDTWVEDDTSDAWKIGFGLRYTF